jgi:hypothetical protein
VENIIYWIRVLNVNFALIINYDKIKIGYQEIFLLIMNSAEISQYCKRNNHIECSDCMCNCHIPGTMENLAKKIAKLDRKTPGIGETI